MTVTVYGLANCDTVRKARRWLAEMDVAHAFHDHRRDGLNPERLRRWADDIGWERLLNRAGTTFRKLPEAERHVTGQDHAVALMTQWPGMIRRPVVEHGGGLLVGFDPAAWRAALIGG